MSDELRYIKDYEIDGDVDQSFLKIVDRFISCIGSVVKILCFTDGNHSKDSAHYEGLAADVKKIRLDPMRIPSDGDIAFMTDRFKELILKPNKSLFEQAIIAKFSGADGVGIYPWGLHIDKKKTDRPLEWFGVDIATCESKLKDAKEKNHENVYFYLL